MALASTWLSGRISRGKATFFTRLALPRTQVVPAFAHCTVNCQANTPMMISSIGTPRPASNRRKNR